MPKFEIAYISNTNKGQGAVFARKLSKTLKICYCRIEYGHAPVVPIAKGTFILFNVIVLITHFDFKKPRKIITFF